MKALLDFVLKLIKVFLDNKKENPLVKELEENTVDYEISETIIKKPKHIICHGKEVEIKWDKVVLWTEKGGLKCDPKQYSARKLERKPRQFTCHWDGCLSSKMMADVLKERGLSCHFGIDNDGTIYQLMDTNHVAWHAAPTNSVSIGTEICNGINVKHQSYYVKNGFGLRQVLKGVKCHNKTLPDILDFYPIQKEALKALMTSVCRHYDIPLQTPLNDLGELSTSLVDDVKNGSFSGVVCHYHSSLEKIDPAGLELDILVEEVKIK